ncbi:MAG: shikimate dehydrogenase [Sphingomonas sp.]|nr:shikimate dehydrogenase [Sphingomonas sp.]RZV52400.1 MAG: shikimate dehydrogenase [Sphingomonadaceae bacterium]
MTATDAPLAGDYAEVIGDPIEQSKSPVIHRFWLEKLARAGGYRRHRVERSELSAYVEKRRKDPHWRGCNVTMPLKLDAIALADEATDRAVAAGAANMLVPREGRLIAANSDIGAVMGLLADLHRQGRAMDRISLLGSGGAARAVLVACRSLGLSMIRIHARDRVKATKLAVEFGLKIQPAKLSDAIGGDGLINATPLGMVGHAPLKVDIDRLSERGWVFDLVSSPAKTPLISAARERGLSTATGLEMLVEQAAASFKIFFDEDAPRAHDAELFARLSA